MSGSSGDSRMLLIDACGGAAMHAPARICDVPDQRRVTAALIVIGNEILSGRTRDANLQYLAEQLNELGIVLAEARVVRDEEDAIIAAVNACRQSFDYVFTTGGIGPTHDDITAGAVAAAFGRRLVRNAEAEALLREFYARNNREVTAARLKMAETPEGASLIENKISTAPGFQVENVFVFAGIPSVMRAMFESMKGRLEGGAKVLSRTLSAGIPEGTIAAGLQRLQDRFPDLEIGSYPYFLDGQPGASIVARGTDRARLDAAMEALRILMLELGGTPTEGNVAG